ncbi:DNA-binding domain-containing protein [Pseudomonas borbori]|uniref:Putative DNA-binding domain-containing protein n=1 Tax=Pseudomonas borbori TaxID=289003 RepID=A0A1I5KFA1_9PSED|nr:DNA-binding domain-containing protein [Pseudomonas borbori]SFO83700.1 Putative DNA-binding domain-containing protein [Pseudomonas borbori]
MNSQAEFVAALLDPERDCPADLKTWNGSDPAARFAVYRNNVLSSLIDALAASFPVVQQLVGETFFRAMAAVYVRHSPPRTRILADYGADFPAFIQGFAPAASLPYLADVARLELLRIRAYHAADAAPLDADALATALAAPERLASLLLRLQPALGLLDSAFAVVSLWAAHQGALTLAEVDLDQAQCALVLRNGLEVEVLGIRSGDAVLIQALLQGRPLGAATQLALACDPAFDLGACLAHLLRAGAITHCAYDTQRPLP